MNADVGIPGLLCRAQYHTVSIEVNWFCCWKCLTSKINHSFKLFSKQTGIWREPIGRWDRCNPAQKSQVWLRWCQFVESFEMKPNRDKLNKWCLKLNAMKGLQFDVSRVQTRDLIRFQIESGFCRDLNWPVYWTKLSSQWVRITLESEV